MNLKVLLIILYTISLTATEVSEFNIMKIKLSMNEEEVINQLFCTNPKIENRINLNDKSIIPIKIISCKSQNKHIRVYLDRYLHVISIEYSIYFEVEPNWDIIEKKFFKKYGHFSKKNIELYDSNKSIYTDFCWGDNCLYNKKEKKYKNTSNEKTLHISMKNHNCSSSSCPFDGQNIFFRLVDMKKKSEQEKYFKEAYKRLEDRKRDKASNIDF